MNFTLSQPFFSPKPLQLHAACSIDCSRSGALARSPAGSADSWLSSSKYPFENTVKLYLFDIRFKITKKRALPKIQAILSDCVFFVHFLTHV